MEGRKSRATTPAVVLDIARSKGAEGELREAEARLVADADALAKLNDWSNRLWRMRNLEEGLDEMLAAVIELIGSDKGIFNFSIWTVVS